MWFHSLLASWKSGRSRGPGSQPRPARRGTRLEVEQLEDRALPSSFTAGSVTDLIADINAANAAGGANTITLAAPTTAPYVLTVVNNTTSGSLNYGNTGLPVIAAKDSLTILGNGDTIERSTATGTPDFRLLRVASGGSLTLENLTLQGGMIEGDGLTNAGFLFYGAGNGGAIYTQGTLVLNGVTIQDNVASGGPHVEVAAGGGIFSYSGSVTLEGGTVIQNNEAIGSSPAPAPESSGRNAYGGGLFASGGTLTVTNATLDNNTAEGGHSWIGVDSSAYGGGLFAGSFSLEPTSLATVVTLSNVTLDGNTATLEGQGDGTLVSLGYVSGAYGGGACLSTLGTGAATLTNCTVQGNSAVGGFDTGRGGGLYILSTATLTNCTVQGNSAVADPYGFPPEGGGLFVSGLETKVTLVNDTVQGNSTLQFNGYGGYSNYGDGGGIYIAAASTSPSLGYTVYLDSFTVAHTINNTDGTGLNGSTANIDGTYILRNL